jgi:acyl-CoA thioesterase-1
MEHRPLSLRCGLTALLMLLPIWLGACSKAPQHAPLAENATVVILGDSLSYGTDAGNGEDYPSLLAAVTGWHIVNAGVPGDTSAGGLERLPELLDAYEIDLLIVALGGNDFLRRFSPEQTAGNLRAILTETRDAGVQALLVAIPQPSAFGAATGLLSDHALYRQLAEETGVPLVEGLFTEVLSKNSLKADAIHPNAAGHRLVAEKLHAALREAGFLSAD